MKHLLIIVVLVFVLLSGVANADRYYKLTALDTEGYESGFSNFVSIDGFWPTIIFAWTPNSEPDIMGYKLWVNCANEFGWMPIPIDIFHLDHCLETECTVTLDMSDPKNITVTGELP
jgi:hypothetical protein